VCRDAHLFLFRLNRIESFCRTRSDVFIMFGYDYKKRSCPAIWRQLLYL
jgi:hypothetical protein